MINRTTLFRMFCLMAGIILANPTFAQQEIKVVPLKSVSKESNVAKKPSEPENKTTASPKKVEETVKTTKAKTYPILNLDESEEGKALMTLDFDNAIKSLQAKITQAKRKKQDTESLEEKLEVYETGLSALQATNKIVFIDSIVVDKDNFLSGYKFDEELGSLSLSADKQATYFVNELGNLTYRAEKNNDGSISINSYFIEDGNLTNRSSLNGIELDGDMNYPFLLDDGTTFYFASRSAEGFGNYDIYVTRYDSEDGTFLQPTNLGYPFNSYANDYMMVVDDNLGIGWFASDRYQPEGKVCIYSFLQPKARKTYDYEVEDHDAIKRYARIASIKDTWKGNEDAIRTARQQLTLKLNSNLNETKKYDFTFIINNNRTYHFLNDFKSSAAKQAFVDYQKQEQNLKNLQSTLDQLRNNPKGETIKSQILQLESQIETLSSALHSSAKEIRHLELQ